MEYSKLINRIGNGQVSYQQIKGATNSNTYNELNSYAMVMFLSGSGTHLINGKKFSIGKNQLHLIFPGQNHYWKTNPGTLGHKIILDEKIISDFSVLDEYMFIKNNMPPVFTVPDKIAIALTEEMELIDRDMQLMVDDSSWRKVISLRMDILMSMIRPVLEKKLNSSLAKQSNRMVEKFWTLIESNHAIHRKPMWYAQELGIAPNYLNTLCKKHVNSTATELIHRCILQEAKKLLKNSGKSIKEITFMLGFDNMPAFSAFFKKMYGITPKEYRN
ncbi:MAG: helix-turn-helix transcriptional regulator [Sphingobacterium sp.]|jgi:AraC-like DNA-binding protein|nr:helix-turn-helix transcriptional regulator [Sphingobacterium sp.]